jgi:hypothetical protein
MHGVSFGFAKIKATLCPLSATWQTIFHVFNDAAFGMALAPPIHISKKQIPAPIANKPSEPGFLHVISVDEGSRKGGGCLPEFGS